MMNDGIFQRQNVSYLSFASSFSLQNLTFFHDFMSEIPLAHCVRGGMVRAVGRERGKKKGGGRNSADTRKLISAALLFPLLPPACEAPFRQ